MSDSITTDVLRDVLRLAELSRADETMHRRWRWWALDHAEWLARALLARLDAEARMPVGLPGLMAAAGADGHDEGRGYVQAVDRVLTFAEAREVVRRCERLPLVEGKLARIIAADTLSDPVERGRAWERLRADLDTRSEEHNHV